MLPCYGMTMARRALGCNSIPRCTCACATALGALSFAERKHCGQRSDANASRLWVRSSTWSNKDPHHTCVQGCLSVFIRRKRTFARSSTICRWTCLLFFFCLVYAGGLLCYLIAAARPPFWTIRTLVMSAADLCDCTWIIWQCDSW